MDEWWTYRPADLLMFSPRVYGRLIELANAEFWPAPWAGAALAAALPLLVHQGGARGARVALVMLALAWAAVGLNFHARHFAGINTAAPYFAAAFVGQAVVWLAAALWRAAPCWRAAGPRHRAGLALLLAAAAWPLLAPALGRPWAQAEVFGLLPDPTVLATLGLLLGLRWPRAGAAHARAAAALRGVALWAVPLAWLLITLGLQWTMAEVLRGV